MKTTATPVQNAPRARRKWVRVAAWLTALLFATAAGVLAYSMRASY